MINLRKIVRKNYISLQKCAKTPHLCPSELLCERVGNATPRRDDRDPSRCSCQVSSACCSLMEKFLDIQRSGFQLVPSCISQRIVSWGRKERVTGNAGGSGRKGRPFRMEESCRRTPDVALTQFSITRLFLQLGTRLLAIQHIRSCHPVREHCVVPRQSVDHLGVNCVAIGVAA